MNNMNYLIKEFKISRIVLAYKYFWCNENENENKNKIINKNNNENKIWSLPVFYLKSENLYY